MSRYINADVLIKYIYDNWIPANIDAIDAQPSIDIVFCKECKLSEIYRNSHGEFYRWCHENIRSVEDDSFCKYGEERICDG